MPSQTYRDTPIMLQGATRLFGDGRIVTYVWLDGKRVIIKRDRLPAITPLPPEQLVTDIVPPEQVVANDHATNQKGVPNA